MPSYIELDKNGSLPSSSNQGKVVFGVNQFGEVVINNQSGQTINSPIYEYTYSEMQDLIADSGLRVSSLYKITDVDTDLYGGTEIILMAVTTNTLSTRGMGKFYNPKYNQNIDGYGIWTNKGTFDATGLSADFNFNEEIIGDGGQVGYLAGTVWEGNDIYFIPESGNWSTVTGITGLNSGSTGETSNFSIPSYSAGTKTIWGGKVWSNVSGETGYPIYAFPQYNTNPSAFDLNHEWEVVDYNGTDYNVVWDEIEFDFTNNFIVSRKEIINNNYAEQSFQDWLDWDNMGDFSLYWRSIKAFQWGNNYDQDNYIGIGDNFVSNSFVETVNYRGRVFYNNKFTNWCNFGEGSFEPNTYIDYNDFNDSYFWNPYFGGPEDKYLSNNKFTYTYSYDIIISYGGSISYNEFYQSSLFNNKLLSSSIENNFAKNNSNVYGNILRYDSNINNNSLVNSNLYENTLKNTNMNGNSLSLSSEMRSNTLLNSQINQNNLNDGDISYNQLDNGYIYYNSISMSSNINSNQLYDDSYIQYNNLNSDGRLRDNNLTGSSINSNQINGSELYGNNLNTNCNINLNVLQSSSTLYNNELYNSYIDKNFLRYSFCHDNNLINSNIRENELSSYSSFEDNDLTGSTISRNSLLSTSAIFSNSMSDNDYIEFNTLNNSNISDNQFLSNASISRNTLNNSSSINSNSTVQSINLNTVICGEQINSQTNYDNNFVQP